jgi:hypothetical protein
MVTKTRTDRAVTNEEIRKYDKMVDYWLKNSVIKNWGLPGISSDFDDMSLGSSGWTLADFRQYLRTEVVIALRNFNPSGKDGRVTKESTFVYGHLYNRIGQQMNRLTKDSKGYGMWVTNLEVTLHELDEE